jgi:hypothetical protein
MKDCYLDWSELTKRVYITNGKNKKDVTEWFDKIVSERNESCQELNKENDAIDFADWIIKNQNDYNLTIKEDSIWCFFKSAHGKRMNTKELYELFQQSK